jgi:uncharacterized protein (DUF2384 family)
MEGSSTARVTASKQTRKVPGGAIAVSRRAKVPPAWRPEERTEFLIDSVGGVTALARALGVSASQPSRWRTGEDVPSPEVASRLLDLEHVIALAMQAWDPAVVMDWLTTANGFLGGAQPVEVLRQRGSAEVIDALKATLSGAFA